MKTIAIYKFGTSSEFELIDLPTPTIKSNEVLIKVHATSVNPLDIKLRNGMLPSLITNFPQILHGDVAGMIESVGKEVSSFKVGDEVYGCVGGFLDMQGVLAEYVAADQALISHKPKSVSMNTAAALPLIAETAWHALVERAQIKPGQKVLIHGGTGGVGHFAIQLAKLYDTTVYTTVSNDFKAALATQLGADVVINYKNSSVQEYVAKHTNGHGFDLVFDTVGGENLVSSLAAVQAGGHVITIAPHGQYDLTPLFLNNATLQCIMQPLPLITKMGRSHYQEILTKVANLVDQGKLSALVDEKIFTFDQVAQAHDHLEQGLAIGKVVVTNNW